ncbi:MAG: hypothetical protein MMC33_006834 [Icmadophila ericetorum]|nr:hypothetical protein [Icmadophila ericetorum]
METLGSVTGIPAVVSAGTKLALFLFEFADSVGSVGEEIRSIGTEISLFCAVLKQLEKTLTNAKSCRYSTTAIETTFQIVERCQQVFNSIQAVMDGLRRQDRSAGPSTDLRARIKWTVMERSKVMKYQVTLESCKLTLHLMISTLEFAQKVSKRTNSTLETQNEDAEEQAMTQSLLVAHRCSLRRLEALEESDEASLPTSEDPLLTQGQAGATLYPNVQSRPKTNRRSRMIDGTIDLPKFNKTENAKRTSVWLQELVSGGTDPREQVFDPHNLSYLNINQLARLLTKWSDQGKRWSTLKEVDVQEAIQVEMNGPKEEKKSEVADGGKLDGTSSFDFVSKELAQAPPFELPLNTTPGFQYDVNVLDPRAYGLKFDSPVQSKLWEKQMETSRSLSKLYLDWDKRILLRVTPFNKGNKDMYNLAIESWAGCIDWNIDPYIAIYRGDSCEKIVEALIRRHEVKNQPWQYSVYLKYTVAWGRVVEGCIGPGMSLFPVYERCIEVGLKPEIWVHALNDPSRIVL